MGVFIAGLSLLMLLAAHVLLSSAVHGTNYLGADGKQAQATVIAALNFSRWFHVTNISPIEGVGSQLLPLNVWANPSFWPFAFLDKELATDISAAIALGVFVTAGYLMARCFNIPPLPSAIAAQLCIVLFASTAMLLGFSTVFCLTPGNAVVYATYMVALGLLGRLEWGSWRVFGLTTTAILLLLLYSISCDPLWSMVAEVSWAVPFAIVTFGRWDLKTILVRCAALGGCFALLIVSGVAGYLHTLSQYTARVQFAETLDRTRGVDFTVSRSSVPLTCAIATWPGQSAGCSDS
jgi:hypothetical protein